MSLVKVPTSKPKKDSGKYESTNEYYNIRITNPYNPTATQSRPTPIVFNTTRTSPILQNPSEYELAVVRFYLPSEVPIFVFDPDGIEPFMNVVLEYNGTQIQKQIIYAPYCPVCIPPRSVIFYQEFLDMINTALTDAYADLKVAEPGLPPTAPPYMIYDASTRLCSILAETAYDSNLPNPVKIYFNTIMYERFFPSLLLRDIQRFLGFAYTQIYVHDTKDNTNAFDSSIPVGYYRVRQEYSSLALWNDLQSVLLETDQIPTEPEFEPTENDTTRKVLTDFEPAVDINDRTAFQFFPQGPLRWYDLKSQYPLRSLDLRALWQSKTGKVYPLYLLQGESATLKIRFRKKGGLKSEEWEEELAI